MKRLLYPLAGLLIVLLPVLLAVTVTERRHEGPLQPVATYAFTQQSWATGAGHAAATETIYNLNGLCERVDVIISSVTANPTVDVVLTGNNGITLASFGTLADGTKHLKLATSDASDFDALPLCENVTVSIDPSADAGGAAQTLTVDVILYLR